MSQFTKTRARRTRHIGMWQLTTHEAYIMKNPTDKPRLIQIIFLSIKNLTIKTGATSGLF